MTTILIDENSKDGRALIESLRKMKFVTVLDTKQEEDWWQAISESEKVAIEEGLSDIDKGRTVSYDKLKERYAHWL